jgi:hypothetical protein
LHDAAAAGGLNFSGKGWLPVIWRRVLYHALQLKWEKCLRGLQRERRRGATLAGCGGREIANKVENCLSGGLPVFFWRTLKEGDRTMASLDWSQCPVVESIPGKMSGAWVLKGTRMPVSAIL